MPITYNKNFGEWVRKALDDRSLSLRQAEYKCGLSATLIKNMTDGRVPDADNVIRFAAGMKLDIMEGLRLAGHDDFAAIWETGRAPDTEEWPQEQDVSLRSLAEDEKEVLEYYGGMPETLKESTLQYLKAVYRTVDNSHLGVTNVTKRGRGRPRKNLAPPEKRSPAGNGTAE